MGAGHTDSWSPDQGHPTQGSASQHSCPGRGLLACPQLLESQPHRAVSWSSGATVLPGPLPSSVVPAGIEDKEAWHGKPLPKNMADQIVQEIHNQIQSKKKILVTPPQEDAPSVNITNIHMPSPPSYKVGEKVQSWALLFWSGWSGHDSLVP